MAIKQMELSNINQSSFTPMLKVQSIEDDLTNLWTANANETDEEGAVIRARVLNIIAYVNDEKELEKTSDIIFEAAAIHPCRAILMLGEKDKAAKDIEAFVSSRCHLSDNLSGRNLCIEQVTMRASGDFVVELPSAALPLLVPDLPSFLWWRSELDFEDAVFKRLCRSIDRVVIDTDSMRDVEHAVTLLSKLFNRKDVAAISDLNWARLTEWRSIIASLFDSPEHLDLLNQISSVEIGYSNSKKEISAKALLIAGWLASRLGWRAVYTEKNEFIFEKNGEDVAVIFTALEEGENKSSFIKLVGGTEDTTTFSVTLNKESSYFDVCVYEKENEPKKTTVFASKKLDEASLLVTELNLLHRDRGYERAVSAIVEMFQA